VYGQGYRELQSHALAYIQATEVGGTHPALVEALGFGNCVLVNDVPEHREVVGDAGLFFEARQPATLAALITDVAARPDRVAECRARAVAHARAHYSWDRVTDQYEALLANLTGGRISRTDARG
jgi:glycosyltransferase involved in cell wall biosynthesis